MQSPEVIRTFSGGFPLVADYGAFGPFTTGGAIVNPRSRCASSIALVMSGNHLSQHEPNSTII